MEAGDAKTLTAGEVCVSVSNANCKGYVGYGGGPALHGGLDPRHTLSGEPGCARIRVCDSRHICGVTNSYATWPRHLCVQRGQVF